MKDLISYIFSGFWPWLGAVIMIWVIVLGVAVIVAAANGSLK